MVAGWSSRMRRDHAGASRAGNRRWGTIQRPPAHVAGSRLSGGARRSTVPPMATRSFWQVGIVGQALVWLVLGTLVVVGLAVWISYEATVSTHRADLLHNLSRWTEDRTAREMAMIERVERQVRECRRLLHLRLQRPVEAPLAIPVLEDGSRRLIPAAGAPPVAVFINATASSQQRQVTAAMVARDLLAELAPTLADYPPNLGIAVPTPWFAGWGRHQS